MKLSERIAIGIGIDTSYVEIIAKRNNQYARYFIKKRNGGKREILQPSTELKVIQRWLLNNILKHFPISEYSYAYSKNNSIKINAEKHKYSKFFLHTDIKDFFSSITRNMLYDYFEKNRKIVKELRLSQKDIELILDICLYRGKYLVVGSAASPRIANMIMYCFDLELKEKLEIAGTFCFTRYADDIIISSKCYIDRNILEMVVNLMKKYGFNVNVKKTYYMNKKHKRQITGVVIDNNQNVLSIGNNQYKKFQRILYNYLIKGIGDLEYIKGYMAYIKFLNEQQYLQLKKIYIRYDKEGKLFKSI